MSPTNSNHGSTSSTSLTSFPFTFGENSAPIGQDRTDFDYRRHSLQHSTDMTLHGGTADISVTPSADATRYRIGIQRAEQGHDGSQPSAVPISGSDNGSQHERGSSDGDGGNELYSRIGARKDAVPSHSSRSPSPSAPAISCTVAVIKAHAFGALRRTRARSKRSSEGAAKVAMDVLESRGIGTGVVAGSKRPRLQEDDLELEET
ncbi:hypothetical protein BDQ17DRAFT_1340624 [Cyathus striatus]|nr:hypothetical protein BDQ17DRAFT_1340624 [Cyathus striatus]